MADTGKPYNLIIPTEYNNDWYSAFVSLIQSIATVVGISEAQMSNCHDYKFLIQDINERLKSHIDSQDTVLDLKTALTKLDLGYGLNQLNVMWEALQAFNWNKRLLSDYDINVGLPIDVIFDILGRKGGALVYNTAAQTLSTGVSSSISWDAETYDTANVHDNVSNNSLFIIPNNIGRVRLSANVAFAANTTGLRCIQLFKNVGGFFQGMSAVYSDAGQATDATILNMCSPVLRVVSGDYFYIGATQTSGVDLTIGGASGYMQNATWFAMEILS